MKNQKGMSKVLMIITIAILAIALPLVIVLVKKNQENRSKAASGMGGGGGGSLNQCILKNGHCDPSTAGVRPGMNCNFSGGATTGTVTSDDCGGTASKYCCMKKTGGTATTSITYWYFQRSIKKCVQSPQKYASLAACSATPPGDPCYATLANCDAANSKGDAGCTNLGGKCQTFTSVPNSGSACVLNGRGGIVKSGLCNAKSSNNYKCCAPRAVANSDEGCKAAGGNCVFLSKTGCSGGRTINSLCLDKQNPDWKCCVK